MKRYKLLFYFILFCADNKRAPSPDFPRLEEDVFPRLFPRPSFSSFVRKELTSFCAPVCVLVAGVLAVGRTGPDREDWGPNITAPSHNRFA